MERADLRAYAERPWAELQAQKEAHWRRVSRASNGAASIAAAELLRQHARSVRPDWPTTSEREADLAHHVEQTRLFQRASRALASS